MRDRVRAFARAVKKLTRRLHKATEQWLDAPTERNTHWLRTSLRRVDACFDLLPKEVRKARRTTRYRRRCRKLFSAIGALRDADVMSEKLGRSVGNNGLDGAPRDEGELQSRADHHRRDSIAKARPFAERVRDARKPAIDPEHMSEAAIDARFAKVVARHGDRLRMQLPAAVGDATRIEELHDARKAAKELRYAYELGGDDVRGRRLAWITALQDLLGDLHDRDVLIANLADLPGSREVRHALEVERDARRAKHEELATWLRRTPTLVDVVAPPALLQLPQRASS